MDRSCLYTHPHLPGDVHLFSLTGRLEGGVGTRTSLKLDNEQCLSFSPDIIPAYLKSLRSLLPRCIIWSLSQQCLPPVSPS